MNTDIPSMPELPSTEDLVKQATDSIGLTDSQNSSSDEVNINNPDTLRPYIDMALRTVGRNPIDRAISETLQGFNISGTASLASGPDDTRGAVFFARPDLCLNDDNLAQHRVMATLLGSELEDDPGTQQRYHASQTSYIRSTLDRRLGMPNGGQWKEDGDTGKFVYKEPGSSPLMDQENTFITLLTNQCKSLSGFPDTVANTKVTSEGAYGQQHIMADSRTDNYSNFKLTATFDEVKGRIISSLFVYWILYMGLIRDARNTRHVKNNVNHRLDYNTRIFHLSYDKSRTKVTGIYDATICIPMGLDDAAIANYERDIETPDAGSTVSVQFECIGAAKYDPISRIEFNRMVASMKPQMYVYESTPGVTGTVSDPNISEERRLEMQGMVLLTHPLEYAIFKKAYPRISSNMDMQWWVSKETYKVIDSGYYSVMDTHLPNFDKV